MNFIKPIFLFAILIIFGGTSSAQISFSPSDLSGTNVSFPTSIQFGPDGRLYVSERYGNIRVFTVVRDSANAYRVTNSELITKIKNIKNHYDDGTLSPTTTWRQITGIYVTGTSLNPIIYVTSSDPREAVGYDSQLDTNSGIISKLTWNGTSWDHVDLVRGIPRSEENHSINGLQIDEGNNILYVSVGGITNMGAPSINFGLTPEYALSAAILSVDLNVIEAMPTLVDPTGMPDYKYNLPTLDDEDRAGAVDLNDPFGGNDGKNQAVIVPGGPVQIYTSGLRNAYDLVITEDDNFFTFDNGPNNGWGGTPLLDSITGKCLNTPNETNTFTHCDQLHYIPGPGYYAGFSNPTRANRENTFNDTIFYNGNLDTILPQSPIPIGFEDGSCEYRVSPLTSYCAFPISNYPDDGSLALSSGSTNGICEYTASNFGGALQGDILTADLSGIIYRLDLDSSGIALETNGQSILFSNFGTSPLDVIAQNDLGIFPGTVWVCNYGSSTISVFEPDDIFACDTSNVNGDADNDGYTNGDETANGTNPCSAASQPADFDLDNISDLLDGDDDNDGINDTLDLFAQDSTNGAFTTLPISYQFDNTNDGGIKGWGFTGLMTDNRDYQDKYDLDLMTVGGAAIKFTIDTATAGTASGATNNQDFAYQFGLNVGSETDNYTIKARAMSPFATVSGGPVNDQSFGLFIGTGDQDNFIKIVCHANSGAGGILVEKEELGVSTSNMYSALILGAPHVDLFFIINPNNNTVQPMYSINNGIQTNLGSPLAVTPSWIDSVLAVGFISTSGPSAGNGFPATWDFIEAYPGPLTTIGNWYNVATNNIPLARHENGFVEACGKFYLIGGRGIKPVQEYNPIDSTWTNKSNTPIQLHHFQAVELDGLIYIVGALTADFPNEVPIPNVFIYNPLSDNWTIGKEIPSNRRRGSAGVVVHNNKIYIIGGIVNGHISGTVKLFDVYDPYANTWDSLPDAPRIRDHFQAAISNNKIVVAGGRITTGLWPTVAEVDIYNFISNSWSTLPSPAGDIPTPRGGCSAVTFGDEVIIIGGENSAAQPAAYNETEALDLNTLIWRSLDSLNTGRHGTQALVSNDGIYTVAGSGNAGGGPELSSLEAFYFNTITQPDSNSTTESILVGSPASLSFGQVLTNTTQSATITITNSNGNQATVVSGLNISGDTEFSLDSVSGIPALPFVLAPGQIFSLTVNYDPTIVGVNTAVLNLTSNGASSPFSVVFNGEGIDTLTSLYRINSGGPGYTSNAGQLFVADNFFVGGAQFAPNYLDTVNFFNTLDTVLYKSEHNGTNFSYEFPVSNGAYEVKLHFAEIYWDAPNGGAGGIGSRVFNVDIEGNPELVNYDIYAQAGGAITAVVETFTVIVIDGELNIDFNAVVDNAKISAIEVQGTSLALTTWYQDNDSDSYGNVAIFLIDSIQPTGYVLDSTDCNDNDTNINPAATEILDGLDNDCDGLIDEGLTAATRVNSGGPNFTSTLGNLFVVDDFYTGGTAFINSALDTVDILNTLDDELYRSERTADTFSYNFPVLDTLFLVKLHFADIYFGATNGGGSGIPGERVFDVIIEGDTVLNDFDIIAEVGGPEIALIKDFNVVCLDGEINIEFIASVDQAKVSAIEILPDSAGLICSVPFDITATNIAIDEALIGWNPVTNSDNFEVRIKETSLSVWSSEMAIGSPNHEHLVDSLNSNTSYDVQVRSLCTDTSAWSDTITFITDSVTTVTCPTPFNLSTVNMSFTSTTVYWDSTLIATQWKIRYGKVGNTVFSTKTITAIPSDNSYLIQNLSGNTDYYVMVRAVCSGIFSDWSDSLFFTTDSINPFNCLKPFNLSTVNITSQSTTVYWDSTVTANDWRIRYAQVGSAVSTTKNITAIPGDNSYLMQGLVPDTDYWVLVRSICPNNNSAFSDTLFFTTDYFNCITAFNLSLLNLAAFTADITWDSSVTGVTFAIRWAVDTVGSPTKQLVTGGTPLTHRVIKNLVPNTAYWVIVRTKCPGNSAWWSTDTLRFTTLNHTLNCLNATNFTATGIDSNQVTLSWDTTSTATKFRVIYRLSGTLDPFVEQNVFGHERVIAGLNPSTTYEAYIRTICAGGYKGPWSIPITFTTLSSNQFNCLQPSINSVSNLTSTSATIGWNTNSTAPQFEIRHTVSGGIPSYTNDTIGPLYSYNLTGLLASTTYEVQVKALCIPASNWSNAISFTTNAFKISSNQLLDKTISITAYPNPTDGNIELMVNSPVNNIALLNIKDITGRNMISQTVDLYEGINYLNLDLGLLKQGLYFINVDSEGYSQRVKIIKN